MTPLLSDYAYQGLMERAIDAALHEADLLEAKSRPGYEWVESYRRNSDGAKISGHWRKSTGARGGRALLGGGGSSPGRGPGARRGAGASSAEPTETPRGPIGGGKPSGSAGLGGARKRRAGRDAEEPDATPRGLIGGARPAADGIDTSHHGDTVNADEASLTKILGKPTNNPEDRKTKSEWTVDFEGKAVTVYDWKRGGGYNIGAKDAATSRRFAAELRKQVVARPRAPAAALRGGGKPKPASKPSKKRPATVTRLLVATADLEDQILSGASPRDRQAAIDRVDQAVSKLTDKQLIERDEKYGAMKDLTPKNNPAQYEESKYIEEEMEEREIGRYGPQRPGVRRGPPRQRRN